MNLNTIEDVINTIYVTNLHVMDSRFVIDDYETLKLLESCVNIKNLTLNLNFKGDYVVDLSKCKNLKIFRCAQGPGIKWKISGNLESISMLSRRFSRSRDRNYCEKI